MLTVDNQIDTTTGTVKLRALFDNSDGRLFPNQFVNIQLHRERVARTRSSCREPRCIAARPNGVAEDIRVSGQLATARFRCGR